MLYYAVYAACFACVCYAMQYYNFGFFAVAIALRACYCVRAIACVLLLLCSCLLCVLSVLCYEIMTKSRPHGGGYAV